MASPAIDYDALAKQYGAISSTPAAAPAATTAAAAIDYDALAKQHGAISSTGGTPQVESSIRYLTTEDYQPPPPEPGAVARFGKQYAAQTGITDLLDIIRASNRYGAPQEVAARGEKAKTALGHLVTGLRDEPARVWGEISGIGQSMLDPKQDTADMSMHMLGAVPMLGPALQGFVHDVWAKKYPEAAADLAALATLTKGPKVAEAAGDVVLRGAQATGRGLATTGTAMRGAVTGAVQAIPAATQAAFEKSIYGALGGPGGMVAAAKIAAAKELGQGAITGARSAVAEAAAARRAAAAASAGNIPPNVTVLSPDYFDRLRLGPGPTITPSAPAPSDASFVRSVPGMYPTGPTPLRALPAPADVIVPEAPPDTSFVRSVPAQYPERATPPPPAPAAAAASATPQPQTVGGFMREAPPTPGQIYAQSQGYDWAKLSAEDRAALEHVAQAQANMAEQNLPVTPPAAQPQSAGEFMRGEPASELETQLADSLAAVKARKQPAPVTPEAPAAKLENIYAKNARLAKAVRVADAAQEAGLTSFDVFKMSSEDFARKVGENSISDDTMSMVVSKLRRREADAARTTPK